MLCFCAADFHLLMTDNIMSMKMKYLESETLVFIDANGRIGDGGEEYVGPCGLLYTMKATGIKRVFLTPLDIYQSTTYHKYYIHN